MNNNMTYKEVRAWLDYHGYDDVITFENPDYETCLIGVTEDRRAVYDYELMLVYLVENGICEEYDEAADFISWNDSFFHRPPYPVIYYETDEDLTEEELKELEENGDELPVMNFTILNFDEEE